MLTDDLLIEKLTSSNTRIPATPENLARLKAQIVLLRLESSQKLDQGIDLSNLEHLSLDKPSAHLESIKNSAGNDPEHALRMDRIIRLIESNPSFKKSLEDIKNCSDPVERQAKLTKLAEELRTSQSSYPGFYRLGEDLQKVGYISGLSLSKDAINNELSKLKFQKDANGVITIKEPSKFNDSKIAELLKITLGEDFGTKDAFEARLNKEGGADFHLQEYKGEFYLGPKVGEAFLRGMNNIFIKYQAKLAGQTLSAEDTKMLEEAIPVLRSVFKTDLKVLKQDSSKVYSGVTAKEVEFSLINVLNLLSAAPAPAVPAAAAVPAAPAMPAAPAADASTYATIYDSSKDLLSFDLFPKPKLDFSSLMESDQRIKSKKPQLGTSQFVA